MGLEVGVWAARVLEMYAVIGLIFATFFAYRGAGVLDPSARASTLGFRILILPGAALLWPLLLMRWARE
jgi:hypothetical protein